MGLKVKLSEYGGFIAALYQQDLWPTSIGTLVKISDMSTAHIKRTINMIERDKWRMIYLEKMMVELKRRDSITYYVEKLIDMLPNDYTTRIKVSTFKQEMRPALARYERLDSAEYDQWLKIKEEDH